ncbi:unnamed protein product [Didymodactylos carnosus]|uniref:Non-specific protein-tyrosine kinase n=1 Tax=Didymodactylos carnosus TaxID=1234261 RepID=A0A814MZN2_9BILA|nr:unnamed protein product [Didymodactylos carnosus]CAF3851917.1 unnamed protein product [Didymodactylos carnosus]
MSNSLEDSLICPITYELFKDPVVAEDGHTYEKDAIIAWIKKGGTSPLTHQKLAVETLRPNYVVKKLVDAFEQTIQKKNYRFKLGVDVKKSRKPLFRTFGKSIFEADWLTKELGPKIVLMKIDGARAKKESSFYVDLSLHPHVVRTFGLVDDPSQSINESVNSVMLLQEYAPEGSLYEFLQGLDKVPTEQILLHMFIQVADAMVFLAHNGIIHGDLACRNILLFCFNDQEPRQNLVKVTDFGLSRHSSIYTATDNVARTTLNIVPTRYAAPEVLSDTHDNPNVYSEKSDIYSMGVTMWEAYSKGAIPWSQIESDEEVRCKVMNGEVLKQPTNCSDQIWLIVFTCMSIKVAERPNFVDLKYLLTESQFTSKQWCSEMENERLQQKAQYIPQQRETITIPYEYCQKPCSTSELQFHQTNGVPLGFAVMVGSDSPCTMESPSVTVTRIIKNGIAWKDNKLRLHDIILRVNNIDFTTITHAAAVEALRNAGNKVTIYIRRLAPPYIEKIELHKSSITSLGFSIAGGINNEHVKGDHGIFITNIIQGGIAGQNGRLRVGDRLMQISTSYTDTTKLFSKQQTTSNYILIRQDSFPLLY